MSISSGMPQPSKPPGISPKKNRVLLVDTSRAKRDLRSETMRKLGVEVDCATDISEARSWWRPNLYDLVLIHVEDSPGALEKFCNDLRAATPPQKVMFLAGEQPEPALASQEKPNTPSRNEENPAKASNATNGESQRWGIQEACRRISSIRSACDARTRAIRNRPEPQRDSETRPDLSLDATIESINREELQ
jgi:CheY-like chemotaxis protein